MQFLLITITAFCLLASIQMVTPNSLWSDVTYFFRQDKKAYLNFSNRLRGKQLLYSSGFFFVLFLINFMIPIKVNETKFAMAFLILIILLELRVQVKWQQHIKHEAK
ncbi:hypothetical protein [Vagococcus silagei]|uniref:SdpI family protein n=1 Tax=Vagococcus silagei TaxID=2508885 RepID=A0A4S3AZ01_9ENTE|nr:hypothetical protein [Vagococcus silagei]THB60054.1 hypothetical protein ESZ54_12390 [Vagococcus silagei]